MRINYIPCGADSVDWAAISPNGDVMAVVQAPQSSLKIFDIRKQRWLSWWKAPRVKNVDQVAVAPFRGSSQVLFHRTKSNQVERFCLSGERLDPIELPDRYDVPAMKVSNDGGSVAIGDSFGNVMIYDISGTDPRRTYHRRISDSAVYALAWNADDHYLYLADSAGQLMRLDVFSEKDILPLHRRKGLFTCFTLASHPDVDDAIAIGGDGSRVWLLNLPFALEIKDDQTAGNGFPLQGWEMEMGDFADRWSLDKRIFLPRVEPEKAAWIDTNVGANVTHLHLTRDWQLMVVGDGGMEVWDLNPLHLIREETWRPKLSRRIFASNETHEGLQVVRER